MMDQFVIRQEWDYFTGTFRPALFEIIKVWPNGMIEWQQHRYMD